MERINKDKVIEISSILAVKGFLPLFPINFKEWSHPKYQIRVVYNQKEPNCSLSFSTSDSIPLGDLMGTHLTKEGVAEYIDLVIAERIKDLSLETQGE